MALIVAVSTWMTFSVLNELASAKNGKGCCESKDCGKGIIASTLWWINLSVAILFTIYVLMQIYYKYQETVTFRAVSLTRRNPVAKGLEMVFGN